jgi:hypothetical protein
LQPPFDLTGFALPQDEIAVPNNINIEKNKMNFFIEGFIQKYEF